MDEKNLQRQLDVVAPLLQLYCESTILGFKQVPILLVVQIVWEYTHTQTQKKKLITAISAPPTWVRVNNSDNTTY